MHLVFSLSCRCAFIIDLQQYHLFCAHTLPICHLPLLGILFTELNWIELVYSVLTNFESKSNSLTTDSQLASLSWFQATIWAPRPIFFTSMEIIFRKLGFVIMRWPFWWEDGSIIYSCCWASPVQSFLGLIPVALMAIFYCLNLETPPSSCIYFRQEQGGPVISIGTGFPFCRLLWLGLWWRYSNLTPHEVTTTD
jgi:hypothetical protein